MITKSRHAVASAAMLLVTMTSSGFAQSKALPMTAARAAAIHECCLKAQPFHNESTWGNWELYIYRACMAEHYQVE